jgi:LacI family gluconate utilization system Gnt-I transcriptional repressor
LGSRRANTHRSPRTRARATDVARIANVSQMTVSRFLREPHTVTVGTQRRIAAAMRKIGYVPNRLAGALAANRTNIICMITADLRNPTLAATVQGVCDAIGDEVYQIMLAMSGRSPATEERIIRECLSHRPCGMLIHNTTHTALSRRMLQDADIPIVEVGNMTRNPIDSVVSYSNFDAIKKLTEHLTATCSRIAFVGLAARYGDRAKSRRDGYFAGLKQAGIKPDSNRIIEAPNAKSGGQILTELVQSQPDTDAVIFAGGDLAYDAVLERRRRGWEEPMRIAIASYDEALVRSLPNVLSLRIPRYDIGRRALETILLRLRGSITEPTRVEFPFELLTSH